MAVKSMQFVCDWCEAEDDSFESTDEAFEEGWWLVNSVQGEHAYCCKECMESDLG